MGNAPDTLARPYSFRQSHEVEARIKTGPPTITCTPMVPEYFGLVVFGIVGLGLIVAISVVVFVVKRRDGGFRK